MTRIKVTAENFQEVNKMVLASDMAAEVKIGQEIETWPIAYEGGQRGQMTVYHPAERAAIFTGGLSVWGDWDEDTRTFTAEDGTKYNESGEITELNEAVYDDAMRAGARFVDAIVEASDDGELDENVTYPEFLQIIVNANSPAWPTFATKLEDEAATTAAWEYWLDTVIGQRAIRDKQAIEETMRIEAEKRNHEEFLRLCEEAKEERNA